MRRIIFAYILAGGAKGGFPIPGVTLLEFNGFEYLVGDFLDSGSESRIYASSRVSGTSHSMPKDVAVKYFCPRDQTQLYKVDREIIALNALSSVDSPNVMKGYAVSDVIGQGEDVETLKCRFLVLSRTGKDLDRFGAMSNDFNSPLLDDYESRVTGKLSVEVFTASVGLLLTEALHLIHERGVTHGDIRDYNVALSYPVGDQPVLIDFGGAMTRDGLSQMDFDENRMEDVDDLNALVVAFIEKRIVKEFGKDQGRTLINNSPLVQAVVLATGLDDLRQILKSYLLKSASIDWEELKMKEILYHIV